VIYPWPYLQICDSSVQEDHKPDQAKTMKLRRHLNNPIITMTIMISIHEDYLTEIRNELTWEILFKYSLWSIISVRDFVQSLYGSEGLVFFQKHAIFNTTLSRSFRNYSQE
jgi:hypothetical protein